jgi:putative hemolysin
LVSSRKERLKQRADAGDGKARTALELADEPTRFLSTVQIGISLIGVLAGAFGGATLAEPLSSALRSVPGLAPYSWPVAFGIVVAAITYLSLIIGELVPKRLAGAKRPGGWGFGHGPADAVPVDLSLPWCLGT